MGLFRGKVLERRGSSVTSGASDFVIFPYKRNRRFTGTYTYFSGTMEPYYRINMLTGTSSGTGSSLRLEPLYSTMELCLALQVVQVEPASMVPVDDYLEFRG
jgi:hypothetical protein